jgi:hypothetical protein
MTSDGGKLALACKNQVVVLSTDSDSPTFVPTKGDRIRDIAFMESTDPKGQPELLLAYNHGIYQWDGEETRHVADVIGVRWIGGGTMRFDQLNGGLYFTTPMLDGVKMMYTIGKQKLDWTYLPPGKRSTDMEGRNGWSSNDLGPLIFARMSPDGKMVLVGSHPQGERVVRMSSEYIHGNCRLTLLDSRDGSILEEFSRENELVVDAVFSPNNRYLLVKWDSLRTEDYPRSWTTSLWSIEEKSELMRFEEEGWSCDPLFTPDSQRFLFGRDLRDTTTGEIIWKLDDAAEGPASDLFRRLVQEGFNKTLISPDGKILVTGHRHGRIAIWSTETGAPIAVMGFTLGENNWYVVAADGRYDGTAKALETLFIQSSSGCETLPVALPKFHEPGLAGRLLPFVGRVTESQ